MSPHKMASPALNVGQTAIKDIHHRAALGHPREVRLASADLGLAQPTGEQIYQALDKHLCRRGAHEHIIRAIQRAALKDTDPQAAQRCAHSLKGSAGNIGAKAVTAAAAELEQACREGDPPERQTLLCKNTIRELEVVLTGIASTAMPEV